MTKFFRFYSLILVILAGLFPQVVRAESGVPLAQFFIQEDHNGDGSPDWASWRAEFQGQIFQISVYDGLGNMQPASSWQNAADFDDDTWVFDRDADGLVELVVRFTLDEQGQRKALLWDDQNKDGRVAFEEKQEGLKILESDYPTMVVKSAGEWLQPGGNINSQLIFEYDGPEGRGQNSLPAPLLPLFANDGRPDLEERLFDDNADGIIDYTHGHVFVELDAAQYGIPQDSLKVNLAQSSSSLDHSYLYWPLLNYEPEYFRRNYFDTPPFVAVDWDNARIYAYGIVGYPIEYGFHVNNLNPWVAGELNQANFENAMAYYDLANNRDGLPELHIRNVYWPSFGSPVIPNPAMPVNEVRYTWRLRPANQLDWDFGLSLTGSNPITTTVTFGKYPVQLVPHDELPSWVVTRPWVNATLVATEDRTYQSSEGIYEWSTLEGVVTDMNLPVDDPQRFDFESRQVEERCVTGSSSCDLANLFKDIGTGLRGEYAPLNGNVMLYRSPVDRRLHLQNAILGIWRQDGQNRILYADASGDGYVDLWQHERDGEIVSSLLLTPQGLIFAQDDTLVLKSISLPPLDYQSPPPVDHQSWQAMGDALLPDFEAQPGSLQAMFDQFSGEISTLHGASIGSVQAGETDLAFSLQISPGYRFDGEPWVDLAEAAPGDYLVTAGDHFEIQPLVSGQLSLRLGGIGRGLREGEMSGVPVVVANPGAQVAEAISLAVYAVKGERVQPVARQALRIPANREEQILVSWQPASGGKWDLLFNLEDAEGQVLTSQLYSVDVASGAHTVLGLTFQLGSFVLALLGLAGLAMFLVAMVWRLLKPVPANLP